MTFKFSDLFENRTFRGFMTFFAVIIAGYLQAAIIQVFMHPMNLLSSGFTGVAILIEKITSTYFNFSFSTSLGMLALNIPVALLCSKSISKRFVVFSLLEVFAASFFLKLFKNPGKIEFIDKKLLRQLIQGDFFSVVLVKILLNILEILFPCGTAALFLGIPALLHQKRQKRSQLFIDLHIPDIGSGRGDLTELAVQLLV